MNLPEKLRSGPFPYRAGLSSSTEMDKGSDKSKHLGNRCEEERRTNPSIQNQCLPFSALDFIPLVGEIGLVQPKLTLGQFFDFRFGVNAGGLFNLPHPIQAQRELRDPGLWALRRR